eukprot:603149-Heterocapsa_arctica.AAC.1
MSKKEEEDVLQWLEENPEMKEDASKDFKKELLAEGRNIARNNITLGNQIFDKLIGAPQAVKTNRNHIDLLTFAKH